MNLPINAKIIFFSLCLVSILIVVVYPQAQKKVINTAPSTVDTSISISQRIEKLEYRFDLESKYSEKRFEDFRGIIGFIGVLFGTFVTILTIINFLRNRQQHKDYLSERKFYEERVTNLEKHDNKSAEQQYDFMEKLGSVIELVRNTFDLQLKREEAQSDLVKKFDIFDQLLRDLHKRYDEAVDLMFTNFGSYKAMEWPSITDEALSIAARARSKFEEVPESVLQTEKEKNPYTLAKLLQLLGISAFYANDIASAFSKLKNADGIYESTPSRSEDSYSRAYTKYFLGIAEKNWRQENSTVGSNLIEAHTYLQAAYNLVKEDKKQFLIPVTFAEIKSYQNNNQKDAIELTEEILSRFEDIGNESLDRNQKSLLIRTYLIRGNIAAKASKRLEACKWYKRACDEDTTNAYANLSYAYALPPNKKSESDKYWKKGLNSLQKSGYTRKRETINRVLILVWAIIAAKKCNDKDNYERYNSELESTANNLHSIDQRIPLFFSPLTKDLQTYVELKDEVKQYLKK